MALAVTIKPVAVIKPQVFPSVVNLITPNTLHPLAPSFSPVNSRPTKAVSPRRSLTNDSNLAPLAAIFPIAPPLCRAAPFAFAPATAVKPPHKPAVLAPVPTYKVNLDPLGKSALLNATSLDAGTSFAELCKNHRGPSCLADASILPHPAGNYLSHLRKHGAAIHMSTSPWTPERLAAAVKQGPHKSANLGIKFVRQEMFEMSEAGQWLVVPLRCVAHLPNLRLSPCSLKSERDRRDRFLCDYSFSGVNAETVRLAPRDSMQFGKALPRLLSKLHHADTRHGPTYMSKTDVSDAFMRIQLQIRHIPHLGVLIPTYPNEEPLVALPMILPMGWVDSPPYLCAVTETTCDLANDRIRAGDLAMNKPLDALADTSPPTTPTAEQPQNCSATPKAPKQRSTGPLQRPLAAVEVYMDDFVKLCQGSLEHRRRVRSTLFECLDATIRPLLPSDRPARRQPNSNKKLLKGDACWTTRKMVLGWMLDSIKRTVELPPHRVDRLFELLDSIAPGQARTSRRKWQQLIGELRSMVLAIPGGRGFFSHLQEVLDYSPDAKPTDRLRLTSDCHTELADIRLLAESLDSRPTKWGEIVESEPSYHGAVDASGTGMGGFWLAASGTPMMQPLAWRQRFEPEIVAALCSFANPDGLMTNSDFEQAGVLCQHDVLAQHRDLRERTTSCLCDNTPAVARHRKASASKNSPSAHLGRLHSLHQRHYRYHSIVSHVPGVLNAIADFLSRRWDLNDAQILTHLDIHYPQDKPWELQVLRPGMNSSVMDALWKRPCKQEFPPGGAKVESPCSTTGPPSVNNLTAVPILNKTKTPSRGYKYTANEYEMDGSLSATHLSGLEQWKKPSVLLQRRTPCWAGQILDTPALGKRIRD